MVVCAAVRGQYEHVFTSFRSENTLYGLSNASKPSNIPTSVCQPRYTCCPRGTPAAERATTDAPPAVLADLQRLTQLAARIAQLAKLLLQSANRVGACAHSIGLGCNRVGSQSGQGRLGGR